MLSLSVGFARSAFLDNGFDDHFADADGTAMKARWTSRGTYGDTPHQREGHMFLPILNLDEGLWFNATVGPGHFQLVAPVANTVEVVALGCGIIEVCEDTAGSPFNASLDTWDITVGVTESSSPGPGCTGTIGSAPFSFFGLHAQVATTGTAVLADLDQCEYNNILVGMRGTTPAHRTLEIKNTTARFGSCNSSAEDAGDEALTQTFCDLRLLGTLSAGQITWRRFWREVGDTVWNEETGTTFQEPLHTEHVWIGLIGYAFSAGSHPFIGICNRIQLLQGVLVDPQPTT